MALTHGYNTLATGLVYIKNDQQAILSWHKYLSNYFEQFILLSTNKNMYCPASQEWQWRHAPFTMLPGT